MAIQGIPLSFVRAGRMTLLLLMILNTAFANSTVVIDESLTTENPDTETSALKRLETKLLFLNETIGEVIREGNFQASSKKGLSSKKLKALTRKLESARCENTDIITVEFDETNFTCLLPRGFCQQSTLMFNLNNSFTDIDEDLLPNLICFMEPSEMTNIKKQHPLRQMMFADERKSRKPLLRANTNEISDKTIHAMKMFLKDLPLNIILNSDVLIENENSNKNPKNLSRKNQPKKDWKLELLKEVLNNRNMTVVSNKVPFQQILNMPPTILCSMLPELQSLSLTQVKKIIVYKKCQEELRKLSASMPQKLGNMVSLLRRSDINNLKNDQLLTLAGVVCEHENVMDSRMEKALAKRILQERLFKTKEEKQNKSSIQNISCLLKYTNPSDLEQLNVSSENKKNLCKMIGASHLSKLPEEEARKLTKFCLKEVLQNNMQLSELGNLMNYIILNDIRNVTASQLLSWASILQLHIHNDEEVKFTGKKLFDIYMDKLQKMTEDDMENVGLFVQTWNDKDRKTIPKESWSNSFDSGITTCQKMDNENNLNFKFCYKIVPFLLKTRSQSEYEGKGVLSRRKRETGPENEFVPFTCENITKINTLVKTITVDQIKSISKEEFGKCVHLFGRVNHFTSELLQSLMVIVNMTFGDVKNWTAENIINIGSLTAGLSLKQMKLLNLSSEAVVKRLGNLTNLMPHQLSTLFENWLKTVMSGNISTITLNHIHLLGKLACGMNKTNLEKLSPKLVMEAVETIGELDTCSIDQQRMWLNKIIASAEETLSQWSPKLITSLGSLTRLLNETTLQRFTLSQLQNVSSKLIAQIPAIQAAVMMEKILPGLINSVQRSIKVSEVKMLVTILCDATAMAKNVIDAETLKNVVNLFAKDGLKCNTKDRDTLLRNLLNSSSESLTDIFIRTLKNITNLIEKPRNSTLKILTRKQLTSVIDAVFKKLPTTHLDAIFKKWFKDLKLRNITEVASLDQEMLGFLACGLGLELDKINEIDGNFIRNALNSVENGFHCPAEKQKMWLEKNFNFASNMLQTLAKNGGLEINSIMGKLLQNLGKDLIKNEKFFQENVKLKNLVMGIINSNETYAKLPEIYRLTTILCRLNTTDITKIDETLLTKFFETKQEPCTPLEQKVWLAAIINSTMHKLVELNTEELSSLMLKLGSLLKQDKLMNNIIGIISNITHIQVNDMINMLLRNMMNVSSIPKLEVLNEIMKCVENINKTELSSASAIENLKKEIDQCIKPRKDLENIMNSTSTKLADILVNYLSLMKPLLGNHNKSISQMLKNWKIHEIIPSIPLGNVSGTFEKWLKELDVANISVNSSKHMLLSFLACNLELDVHSFDITPHSIIKSIEKFARPEPCSLEKQKSWLKKSSNLTSGLMQNLANVLKNMINAEGMNITNMRPIATPKSPNGEVEKENKDDDDEVKNGGNDDEDKNGGMNITTMRPIATPKSPNGEVEKEKKDDDGSKTTKNEKKDNKPSFAISKGGNRKERFLVKDDFPFSEKNVKTESGDEIMKKLWNFTRSPVSQKEAILLKMATKKAIKYLLKNYTKRNEYLNKSKTQLLGLANNVNMGGAFLDKTEIDEEFLSTVHSIKSEVEAQTILKKAMKNIQNKSRNDFIKTLPAQLIKKSGMMLIDKMYSDDTKAELIQRFQPKSKPEKDTMAANKVKEEKTSLAEFGLLKRIMKDKPDDKTLSLVLRSSLLAAVSVTKFDELPTNLLCDINIAINELQTEQVLTMFKKCSSMVKNILKSNATRLGIITTKVPKDMINELNKEQLTKLTEQACLYENELDVDQEKLMFSAFLNLGVDVAKESNEIGCTIKHAVKEIKQLDVSSQPENVKSLCKNLGSSMKEKISKESGKIYKNICFKLLNEKKLSFEELGSLIFFFDVSDIKKLDDENLLEGAQILSQRVQDKSVFEEISNRLENIPSLSNPTILTPDNITLVSIFIGGWNNLDQIPKESVEQASLLLTEVINTQMQLKKSCMKEIGDVTECSQLEPYLKNVIKLLVAKPPKSRRKRRAISSCNCELLSQLGYAAEMLTPDSLNDMLCPNNFISCMEKISEVTNWNNKHQAVFAEKAISILETPLTTVWSQANLKSVVAAIPGLTTEQIKSLNLSSLELASAVGKQNNWDVNKLNVAFNTFYKKLLKSNSSEITSLQLKVFGNLLCGMNTDRIDSIKTDEYLNAIEKVGVIGCFTNDQDKVWIKKAKILFDDVNEWTKIEVSSIGAVISGLSAEDLQKLTSIQIKAIKVDIIPKIDPKSLKNFHPNQLSSMTTSQAMKMTAAQKDMLNDEQLKVIKEKVDAMNSFLEQNNSRAGRSYLNISTMILSILLIILP